MRFFVVILCLTTALFLNACEQETPANPNAPATYNGNWVTFSYPNSWEIKEEKSESSTWIRIQGPGNASFSIEIRSLEQAPSLEAYASEQSQQQTLNPVARPATSGRLHGFIHIMGIEGESHQREYHRIDSHDEAAFLVSEVPTAEAIHAQSGLDRIFTTFAFQ